MAHAQGLRGLLLAGVAGLTLAGAGCLKHSVKDDDRKPVARTAAEEDTFEILQGDWMRQHERPYTPPGGQ